MSWRVVARIPYRAALTSDEDGAMRGRVIGVAASAVALWAAFAAAANARECERVPFQVVVGPAASGYAPAGQPFAIKLLFDGAEEEYVRDVSVTIGDRVYPLPDLARPLMADAPAATGRFTIWIAWRQEGSPDGEVLECTDEVGYDAISVLSDSTIGEDGARVDGRWRVQATAPRYLRVAPTRMRWTFSPDCDYGGCDVVMTEPRSTPVRFRAREEAYTSERQSSRIACTRPDGRTVPGGYLLTGRYRFEVDDWRYVKGTLTYQATRISGVVDLRYALTPKGRAHGCRGGTLKLTLRGAREGDR